MDKADPVDAPTHGKYWDGDAAKPADLAPW
jgi:hypothetical protein